MIIPAWAWFITSVACMAGLIAWYRKTKSRHLLLAAGGLGWSMLIGLPELYADMFGYEELSRLADNLFEDANWAGSEWNNTGQLLIFLCGFLVWPGTAFLTLGLWRQGSSLAPAITTPVES